MMKISRAVKYMASIFLALAFLFPQMAGVVFALDNEKFSLQSDIASTRTNPIPISSAEEFYEFAQFISAQAGYDADDNELPSPHGYYRLTRDIDLSAYGSDWNDGMGWEPIAEFRGFFDGAGHVITGLYISRPKGGPDSSPDPCGLFGSVDGEVINLGLVDARVAGDWEVGGVAGNLYGRIQNCYVTGSVSGHMDVGGIVGSAGTGSIASCYTTCTVSETDDVSANKGRCIGGVAGKTYGAVVKNCYSTGDVIGNWDVGGVVGEIEIEGVVKNCYATGRVTGNKEVGGVVGFTDHSVLGRDYSESSVINCAALNPSVAGDRFTGRVLGAYYYYENSRFADGSNLFIWKLQFGNNYALTEMTLDTQTGWRIREGEAGRDMTRKDAAAKAFWTDKLFFDETVWNLEENRLPTLKGLAGQS